MRTDSTASPAAERRQGPRQWAVEIQATVTAEPGQPPRVAAARNLGPGGIRLSLDYRFHPGMLLELKLQRAGRDWACLIQATVVYVLETETGHFITGCAFTRPLSDEELRGLL